MSPQPRLLRITTVPISLKLLLKGQPQFMQAQGFEVMTASAGEANVGMNENKNVRNENNPKPDSNLQLTTNNLQPTTNIPHVAVPLTRKISPFTDLVALWKLIKLINTFKPQIVHTHTPKAGLIGMLAAWICRVPVRMHTVAGLPLMEATGYKRKLLEITEKITYACAHQVYPNSTGLLHFMRNQFYTYSSKYKIIGKGSSNGIDTSFFTATPALQEQAEVLRREYAITKAHTVFCFIGRIVGDKGINELLQAFDQLSKQHTCKLLLVGREEAELDPINEASRSILSQNSHILCLGYRDDVRIPLLASDVFVFPSYREGFPNVVMQAQCMGIPCIVSNINGCNELVQDGVSGLIVPPKNTTALQAAMQRLLVDQPLRKACTETARQYVAHHFEQRYIWQQLQQEYYTQLAKRGWAPSVSLFSRYAAGIYTHLVKPFFDKAVALLVLTAASPILLLVMGLLFFANKGKVFFVQQRPGRNGEPFHLIKLRTMTDARDAQGHLLPDAQRLHGAGAFVRKTSIDELPQLINVLRGEMSIVGPRPLLMEYLPLYSSEQQRRHAVKPGITGWAQVNGRNTLSWTDKFAFDVWYVDHIGFLLDSKIIFKTILKVFKSEGISSTDSVTMTKFEGNT